MTNSSDTPACGSGNDNRTSASPIFGATVKQPPTYLYKYRSLAGPAREFTKAIFETGSLYYATPAELNDPFECFPVMLDRQPDAVRWAEQERLIEKYTQHLSIAERNRLKRRARARPREEIEALLTASHLNWRTQLGICSLTACPDDVLMWSHYADSNRGICLQFRTTSVLQPHFLHALPVIYVDERPTLDMSDRSARDWPLLERTLLMNAKRWEYEQEWRLIDQDGHGPHSFPKWDLVGVILGASISLEDAMEVSRWAAPYCKPDRIHRAERDPRQFTLNVPGLPRE